MQGNVRPQGFALPATQCALNYGLLAVVFGAAGLCAIEGGERPVQPLKFAAVAFLDVQANYAIVMAYRFTSLTSVTLLDCATIPGAAMRRLPLQPACIADTVRLEVPRHRCPAAVLVAAGPQIQPPAPARRRRLCCRPWCAGDHRQQVGREQPRSRVSTRSLGRRADLARRSDVLGMQCRGRSTARRVLELRSCCTERLHDEAMWQVMCRGIAAGEVETRQWLAQIGCWGFAFSCVQMLLLERTQLAAVTWSFQVLCGQPRPPVVSPLSSRALLRRRHKPCTVQVIAPLCGFTATLFAFYCGVPFVLRGGGAAVLNLSLLTSDLWAAAAQLAFFGTPAHHAKFTRTQDLMTRHLPLSATPIAV